MADVSGQSQQSQSLGYRSGQSTLAKTYPTMPSYLSDIIRQQTEGSAPSAELLSGEHSLLSSLLTQDRTQVPYPQVGEEIMNSSPTDYVGDSSVAAIAGRNPYSTEWESATQALYDRTLRQGLAQSQTGPGNVRGGTARQGYAMADMNTQLGLNRFREIEQQQRGQANDVMQATQIANAIEGARRGTRLQAQQNAIAGQGQKTQESLAAAGDVRGMRQTNLANVVMASDLLGRPTQTQNEQGFNFGGQEGTSKGFNTGVTCCFIFLEALNGELPWYVRRGRDDFNTKNRRAGYVWMSRWLCPAMRVFPRMMNLVNAVMIKPFLRFGKMHYIEPETRGSCKWLISRVPCQLWFWTWSFIGWVKKGSVK